MFVHLFSANDQVHFATQQPFSAVPVAILDYGKEGEGNIFSNS
jgi:hypothetical protein